MSVKATVIPNRQTNASPLIVMTDDGTVFLNASMYWSFSVLLLTIASKATKRNANMAAPCNMPSMPNVKKPPVPATMTASSTCVWFGNLAVQFDMLAVIEWRKTNDLLSQLN